MYLIPGLVHQKASIKLRDGILQFQIECYKVHVPQV